MLQLKVGNIFTDIIGYLPQDLFLELQKPLSFRPEGYEFSSMYNTWVKDGTGRKIHRIWDGWKRQIWKNKTRTYFPTGLFSLVKEAFANLNIEYQVFDCRIKPEKNFPIYLNPELIIRNYQHPIIQDAAKLQRGIIQVATGGGKSKIISGIIAVLGVKPFIVFVTSIDLLSQARKALEEDLYLDGNPIPIGQIGGGVLDIKDINVMTVQTAVRAIGGKWDSKHKFDSEDTDDKTPIESKKTEILNLLKTAKGCACDECVSGDAEVTTKNGLVPMKELDKFIGKEILSFSGNSVVWKKITHFYSKGEKKTLEINLENENKIKCTEEHLIMTKQRWKSAGTIQLEDQILCSMNVDVDKKFTSKEKTQVNTLSTSQNTSNTNYVKVKSITSSLVEDVFDITVEDTHCFFANNFLVHNCQHWKAETCQLVTKTLQSSYYIFGCSATPKRDSGDDLMINACFGKTFAKISASQLIREKWLIKPNIKIIHVRGEKSKFRQWQQLYKDQITDNIEYNTLIANITNSYIEAGRLVLVLVVHINHGKLLSTLIPNGLFISGKAPKKKREQSLDDLREGKIRCIISTQLFDEGINVVKLDTVVLGGQGRSKTRALQRIGRILRPSPGKTTATAIDFRVHQKYLLQHSIEREKMYKTEEEYDIEHIDES